MVTATDGRDESAPVRVTAPGRQPDAADLGHRARAGRRGAPGQEVTAVPEGMDPDGDELEYEFEWPPNGNAGRGADRAAFSTAALLGGDRLKGARASATARSGARSRRPSSSSSPTARPASPALPAMESVGGGIRAQLEAQDPDGDRSFRYRVIEGPRGLSVDPSWASSSGSRRVGTHRHARGRDRSGRQPRRGERVALRVDVTTPTHGEESRAASRSRTATPMTTRKRTPKRRRRISRCAAACGLRNGLQGRAVRLRARPPASRAFPGRVADGIALA